MRRFITPLTVVGVLLTSTLIWACSVPVFRYALERWPADKYSVVIYYRGKLNQEHQKIVAQFDKEGTIGQQSANVELRLIDLDSKPAPKSEDLELWKIQKTETLPLMVVRTPLPAPVPSGFWSGELSEENVAKMIDSPLRKNIAKQLINGQTAVWVFLESGNPEKDKSAFALLSKELKRMEKTLKLPEIEEADIEQGLVSVSPDSLKLKFSLEKCSREDSAEAGFTSMLLATENDLKEFTAEPMAFPVFGRGRVLYALIGKGINSDTIEQACRDLTGPCTCQVKDQNPGTDLLMAVNWEKLVTPTTQDEKELPPLTGLTGYSKESKGKSGDLKMSEILKKSLAQNGSDSKKTGSNSSEDVTAPEVATTSTTSDKATPSLSSGMVESPNQSDSSEMTQGSSLFRNMMIMAAMMLVVVLGASYFLMARK
ncbi:MAG: hypothetical protein K0U86_19045 [Planctomycetes bacterium]|nr:hypothetical protein [Planctomycetota bacterium]MCH9727006.1 hypothetical protein [Planctomycetota bacterium]MCH9775204.1 hypothetical protein [Planctomycetota bacterium]